MGDAEQPSAAESPASEDREFRPGDHVWMQCEAIGGIGYQHHGIVVRAKSNRLYIADFSAPNQSTIALPTSITSNAQSGGRMLDWHGVRIATFDAAEWHKEQYADDEVQDDNELVLKRVTFLLQNPYLIPPYELLESNCETVAVWCKTGQFRTHQIAGLIGGGIRNSAVATGLLAASSVVLGPIPAVVGAGVSLTMSLKQSGNENKWRERTEILNEEFEKWQKAQEWGCCIQ
ncbi:hypothetical protein ACHAXT_005433 [Thalassiosira profunda]